MEPGKQHYVLLVLFIGGYDGGGRRSGGRVGRGSNSGGRRKDQVSCWCPCLLSWLFVFILSRLLQAKRVSQPTPHTPTLHTIRRPPKEKLRAIRQHVNPLSRSYQQPVELPEGWVRAAYKDPSKPFHIDIGSARGRFCVDMALAYPGMNFLGLEIRRPCVEEAFKKRERAGAEAGGNCHFLACNANVDLARVVADVRKEGAEVVRCT